MENSYKCNCLCKNAFEIKDVKFKFFAFCKTYYFLKMENIKYIFSIFEDVTIYIVRMKCCLIYAFKQHLEKNQIS